MAETMPTGWIPQPDDERDWIYRPPTNVSFKVKDHIDLRDTHHMQREAYHQGDMLSCTANAIASALRYGKNAEAWGARNEQWNPSRMFLWYHERILNATDGNFLDPTELHTLLSSSEPRVSYEKDKVKKTVSRARVMEQIKHNVGSNKRYGFRTLKKYGVCSEERWPYLKDAKDVANPSFYTPPEGAMEEAKTFVAPSLTYWRIKDLAEGAGDNVIKHMEAALSEHYPVLFGFRASEAHANLNLHVGLDKDHVYTGWVKDDDETWGHGVVCVGFNRAKQLFLVLNSWGPTFGDGGYFFMPYRWFGAEHGMYIDKHKAWGKNGHLPRCDDIWVVKSHMPAEGTLGTDVTKETTLNH